MITLILNGLGLGFGQLHYMIGMVISSKKSKLTGLLGGILRELSVD